MKLKWTENRALACIVLTVAVLAGVVGIGGAKARSLAAEPAAWYADNMSADFAARESAAGSLIALARDAGVDESIVEQANAALDASCEAADSPSARYAAGLKLKTAVELLYNALPAPERDNMGGPAQMAWSEFSSRTSILSHSVPEYNALVRAAQEKLSGFPASLLAGGADLEEMA